MIPPPPPSDTFDVVMVAGYYNFDKERLQADQRLFNRLKTAAVIDVLHENSLYEITPEFRGKVVPILAVIPATSCSEVKAYFRNAMGQHRLNSLAIICNERASVDQVIVNSMNKVIGIFGKRHARKNFFL